MSVTHEQTRKPRGRPPGANPQRKASDLMLGWKDKDGKPIYKNPNLHYVEVEKLNQSLGLPDKEGEYLEMGYEKLSDRPRDALYAISTVKRRARQKSIYDEANNRLLSREKLGLKKHDTLEGGADVSYDETKNETTTKPMTASQMAAGMPDASSD